MGKIVFENFNEGDGYYNVNLAYLSKEQFEEIKALFSKWNPTEEDIKDCIRMCLTDANEQRFNAYGTTFEACLSWLEKQGNPADKVGPKFKVGDWVTDGYCRCKIAFIDSRYWYSETRILGNVIDIDRTFRLWSLQDAKDGDVLAFSDDTIVIFKDLYNSSSFHSYCHIEDGEFGISEDDMPDWWKGKGFLPATKEQRELLYSKMKDAGYEWDEEKKGLRKIEQVFAWSGEDEHRLKDTIYFLDTAKKHYASTVELDACIDWINSVKQRMEEQQ